MTMHSATLAINEAIIERRARGERVLHLGFGEAGLPVLPEIRQALEAAAELNGYGQVVGSPAARAAAAGWFERRGLPTVPEQILFAPGSKALLFAALAVLPGDLVIPTPSWVSYAAQAELLGKATIPVGIPEGVGGVPDPAALEAALSDAVAAGRMPGVLILTVPDNPTGTAANAQLLASVAEIASRYNVAIISDEIYASVVHDGTLAASVSSHLSDRFLITTGLSKSLALGGWRIGYARTPDTEWGRALMGDLIGVASEVWSSLAAPQQAAAAYVLSDPEPVTAHVARSTRLHAAVATAVFAEFDRLGIPCRRPSAGFYLYPDFEPHRVTLAERGIAGGDDLARVLLEEYGVGVLAGPAFGDAPEGLRARVATSLLYGETSEQRWEALAAADPTTLPWIAEALDELRTALEGLLGRTDGTTAS